MLLKSRLMPRSKILAYCRLNTRRFYVLGEKITVERNLANVVVGGYIMPYFCLLNLMGLPMKHGMLCDESCDEGAVAHPTPRNRT